MSKKNKKPLKKLIKCPYCEKTGGIKGMKRWHFENCKYKPLDDIESSDSINMIHEMFGVG